MSENIMCNENRNKRIELPKEFTVEVMDIIKRIVYETAAGVLYLKNDTLVMYTVPHGTQLILSTRLPQLNRSMKAAVIEIDALDELISYRIITKKDEISVVTGSDFTAVAVHRNTKFLWASKNKKPAVNLHNNMKVITNLLKDALDEHLVRTVSRYIVFKYSEGDRSTVSSGIDMVVGAPSTVLTVGEPSTRVILPHRKSATAAINTSNPMVDRIMDDESVEGVIMTNKEGAPILTNVSVTRATLYARVLHKYSIMSMTYMTELDPLDEILVIRMQTKKNELILTPHREFLIVIVQHSRKNTKVTNVSKR